jgi:1-acyl-sn-glycerol-3-phosphate acyltransferase
MKASIGRLVLRVLRYDDTGEAAPADQAYVLVAAPHTSWLDLPLMLGYAWAHDVHPGFLAKKELFVAPFGGVLRRLGGIQVDRADPGGLVDDLVRQARSGAALALVIAPEGTRDRAPGWKSGFYRIAQDAGIPIVLGYLDGPTRSGGFGPALVPSGDIASDMDVIRAFYADKHGVVPVRSSPVRLRSEPGSSPDMSGDAPEPPG